MATVNLNAAAGRKRKAGIPSQNNSTNRLLTPPSGGSYVPKPKAPAGSGMVAYPTATPSAPAPSPSINGLQKPAPITPGMGFMPYYEEARRGIDRNRAEIEASQQTGLQRLQAMLQSGTRDLERERGQAQQSTTNQLAGQGILRSGITVDAQNRLGQQYADQIANLGRNNAWDQENLQSQVAQQLQALNSQLEQLNIDQARAQSEAQLEADRINAENEAAWQRLQAEQPQTSPTGQYSGGSTNPGGTGYSMGSQLPQHKPILAPKQPIRTTTAPTPVGRRIPGERYDSQGRVIL